MFLGVDGGGTKTAFVLIDEHGRMLAKHEGAGTYYLETGIDELKSRIETGVRAISAKAGISRDAIRFAFFGLPAYGEDHAMSSVLDDAPSAVLPRRNYRCDNDVVCAWAGALACSDGISVVAGTGSIGFGRHDGRSTRCGGWGEVFGDEGSAYWIAREGLRTFSRMSDGRLAKGALYDLIKREFALARDLDLSGRIINLWSLERSRIASIAPVVAAAAAAGDEAAVCIFSAAAVELAEMVEAMNQALGFPADRPVPVSFSGGVFKAGRLIMDPLRRLLGAGTVNFDIREPAFPPSLGAAYYAGVLAGCASIERRLESARPA